MALLSLWPQSNHFFFGETTKIFPQSRPDPRPDSPPGLPAHTLWGAWRCHLCSDGLLSQLIQGTGKHNPRDQSASSLQTRNRCTYTALPRTRMNPTSYAPKHAQLLTKPALLCPANSTLNRVRRPHAGASCAHACALQLLCASCAAPERCSTLELRRMERRLLWHVQNLTPH